MMPLLPLRSTSSLSQTSISLPSPVTRKQAPVWSALVSAARLVIWRSPTSGSSMMMITTTWIDHVRLDGERALIERLAARRPPAVRSRPAGPVARCSCRPADRSPRAWPGSGFWSPSPLSQYCWSAMLFCSLLSSDAGALGRVAVLVLELHRDAAGLWRSRPRA